MPNVDGLRGRWVVNSCTSCGKLIPFPRHPYCPPRSLYTDITVKTCAISISSNSVRPVVLQVCLPDPYCSYWKTFLWYFLHYGIDDTFLWQLPLMVFFRYIQGKVYTQCLSYLYEIVGEFHVPPRWYQSPRLDWLNHPCPPMVVDFVFVFKSSCKTILSCPIALLLTFSLPFTFKVCFALFGCLSSFAISLSKRLRVNTFVVHL